jgi:predicted transcriptional regulator of viral defense system
MNYQQFHDEMNAFPVFSIREIEKHFPDFDSRRLVEWQEKGYIQKLRNRFYYFAGNTVNERYLFFAANELYSPSYISLESALSWYGFIPEGVFQVTSCSSRKTQSFGTPLGSFSYRHIKPALFFGYRLEEWNNHHFAIAEPEKTVIDYLYLHHEIRDLVDFESLRWNSTEMNNSLLMEKIDTYASHIGSKALLKRLFILKEFLDVNPT